MHTSCERLDRIDQGTEERTDGNVKIDYGVNESVLIVCVTCTTRIIHNTKIDEFVCPPNIS